jgi:hypothetical protein
MADAITSLVKVKEPEKAHPHNATQLLGEDLRSIMKLRSTKERIELLEE